VTVVNLFVFITELKWFVTQRFRVFSNGIMWNQKRVIFFFYVLLTVHLGIFISLFNQLDAQKFVSQ